MVMVQEKEKRSKNEQLVESLVRRIIGGAKIEISSVTPIPNNKQYRDLAHQIFDELGSRHINYTVNVEFVNRAQRYYIYING